MKVCVKIRKQNKTEKKRELGRKIFFEIHFLMFPYESLSQNH